MAQWCHIVWTVLAQCGGWFTRVLCVGVHWDTRVGHGVQGDIMTERQLELVHPLDVSLWLLWTGLCRVKLMFIIQHTASAALHVREGRSEDVVPAHLQLRLDHNNSTCSLIQCEHVVRYIGLVSSAGPRCSCRSLPRASLSVLLDGFLERLAAHLIDQFGHVFHAR